MTRRIFKETFSLQIGCHYFYVCYEEVFWDVVCFLLAIFRIMSQTVFYFKEIFSLLTEFCWEFLLASQIVLRTFIQYNLNEIKLEVVASV